jgi:hypothetical protein
MIDPRDVASATIGLAWKAAVPLVGVAILLGLCSGREPARGGPWPATKAARYASPWPSPRGSPMRGASSRTRGAWS